MTTTSSSMTAKQQARDCSSTSSSSIRAVTFPRKLHKLLCEASEQENGHDDVISWLPDGKSFKVHDRTKFANEIMPKFFGSSKFRSFQKNLNMWNFRTASTSSKNHHDARRRHGGGGGAEDCRDEESSSTTKGTYFHPFFIRDEPSLCHRIIRQPIYRRRAHAARATTSDASRGGASETGDRPTTTREEAQGNQEEQQQTTESPPLGRSTIDRSPIASAIRNSRGHLLQGMVQQQELNHHQQGHNPLALAAKRGGSVVSLSNSVMSEKMMLQNNDNASFLLGGGRPPLGMREEVLLGRAHVGTNGATSAALLQRRAPSPLLSSFTSMIDLGHTSIMPGLARSDELILSSLMQEQQHRHQQAQRSISMSLEWQQQQQELSFRRLEEAATRRNQATMRVLADIDRLRAMVTTTTTSTRTLPSSERTPMATAFVS